VVCEQEKRDMVTLLRKGELSYPLLRALSMMIFPGWDLVAP